MQCNELYLKRSNYSVLSVTLNLSSRVSPFLFFSLREIPLP